MARKKGSNYNSQTFGLLWLSMGLIVIVAVAFFSPRHQESTIQMAFNDSLATEIRPNDTDSNTSSHRHSASRAIHSRYSLDTNLYSAAPLKATRQPLIVELNSADTLTLQLIHGIGPSYARRIVRYRERLGGFIRLDQLLEVRGFTPDLLDHIAPNLILDRTNIHPIAINSVTLKQLIRHPYIEYYQARDIIFLRNSGTYFHSETDLRAIPSMADSTLQKILPYIDFSPAISGDTISSMQ